MQNQADIRLDQLYQRCTTAARFDDILPVLNDDIRVKAAAEYRTGTQDLPGKHDQAFKARVDSNVLTLESPELINVSDFLLKRIEILAEDAKRYTKKWNEFEP